MRHVYKALRQLTEEFDDVEVVFPVHKNLKVREVVCEKLGGFSQVHLIDPLDYEPFANLMHKAYLILTSSGTRKARSRSARYYGTSGSCRCWHS